MNSGMKWVYALEVYGKFGCTGYWFDVRQFFKPVSRNALTTDIQYKGDARR